MLIEKESSQYETTIENCKCGETALLSSMMMVDIPCSHRFNKGARFPSKADNIRLRLTKSTSKLTKEVSITELGTEDEPKDYNAMINSTAVKTVRKFTKCKNIHKISGQIPAINIEEETNFANGKPIGFFTAVSEGIHKFSDYKKERSGFSTSSDVSSGDF